MTTATAARTKKAKTKPADGAAAKDAVESDVVARPFFKMAGGKGRLLPVLRRFVPETFEHYHEPFVGGGALFWDLAARRRLRRNFISLSDANPVLMRVFRAVKNDVEVVIKALKKMPITEEHYYSIRSTLPADRDAMSDVELAVWFLYVNKTCVNGIYRVNKNGGFNVPWGRWEQYNKVPNVCDEPLLRACSAVLQTLRVSVTERPFETVLDYAKKGDLVYFDPPYLPTSKTANFTSYTKERFVYEDHVRLRDVALELKKRAAHVILSNADVPLIRELYEPKLGFTVDVAMAPRSVNTKTDERGDVRELVIR